MQVILTPQVGAPRGYAIAGETIHGPGWSVDLSGLTEGLAIEVGVPAVVAPVRREGGDIVARLVLHGIAADVMHEGDGVIGAGAEGGPLRAIDFATAEPIDPPPTASDVRAEGNRRLEALVTGYSPGERESWPTQVAEATLVLTGIEGEDPEAPMLRVLADARGITLGQMAQRVIANRDALRAASAAILAAQTRILALDPIPADYADDARWP